MSLTRIRRIVQAVERHGLGRRHAPDANDHRYLMRAITAPPVLLTRYWMTNVVLDQGQTSECVANAWTGFLACSPIQTRLPALGGLPFVHQLYVEAQERDEWPGANYDGTSVRGGVKALVDRRRVGEYRWAFEAETARIWVLTRGPLVFGTNWHRGMFVPDVHGFLDDSGAVEGGHAYLIVGFSEARRAFRVVNSWGRAWGDAGRAWLHFDVADRLIQAEGEACSAIETRVPKAARRP
jgi:hypothetical protein